MADVFIGGLAAGLILLAAALLVFNTGWSGIGFASTGWFAPSHGIQPELITAELGQSYEIGKIVTAATSEIDLGQFGISGIATEQTMPGGVVQSGVFFGEQSLRYSVENPTSIRFTVNRTNDYGPLLVIADGEVVFEGKLSLGDQIIPLNLEGDVELELSVPSSGWKLWAPVLYDVTNVKISSVYPIAEYDFARDEDFSWAELQLSFTSRQGTLDVNLNDEQLWTGNPSSTQKITFDEEQINDINALTLAAKSGSSFSGTAKLAMHYEHVDDKKYETSFNLTSAQIDKLPGHIIFEVPNVEYGDSSNIGNIGTTYTYSTGGSYSSLGHSLEYQFDWGDGSYSAWSDSTTASHYWSYANVYTVRTRARCTADTSVVSGWSAGRSVNIGTLQSTEIVSTPNQPTGVTSSSITGVSYTYSTGGSYSSLGYSVEYRFDWGDGSYSAWSSSTTASHYWTSVSMYTVRVQARSAYTSVASSWSSGLQVSMGTTSSTETVSTPYQPTGTIEGNVGTIVIKFIVGDQIKLAEAIDVDVGTNSVAFYKSNIVPGNATKLVIEGGDGALFDIRNLKVWV